MLLNAANLKKIGNEEQIALIEMIDQGDENYLQPPSDELTDFYRSILGRLKKYIINSKAILRVKDDVMRTLDKRRKKWFVNRSCQSEDPNVRTNPSYVTQRSKSSEGGKKMRSKSKKPTTKVTEIRKGIRKEYKKETTTPQNQQKITQALNEKYYNNIKIY